jgi:hypothetical protein
MIRPAMRLVAGVIVSALLGGSACAHALAQRYDLPLPLGFFLAAAGIAVAVSFVILALFWRHDAEDGKRTESPSIQGTIPCVVLACCRVFGVGLLILIVCAGLFGNQSTFKNVTPVMVWVIWWVGLSFLCAFVGNVWELINPWPALFAAAERLARPLAKGWSLRLPYPEWLGAWPACALLLLFAWFELVAPGRDIPRNIAIAVMLYSAMTWAGFAAFGREQWLRRGEVFSVVFDLFGRFAPLQLNRDGYWALRPFAAGLLARTPLTPSMTAFTLLMLGTVTVDGFMETPLWSAIAQSLTGNAAAGVDATVYGMLQTALLLAGPLLLAALYLTVIAMMAQITRLSIAQLAGLFVQSLVPIAIAYHLAHYFTLLAIAGQFIIPLASDPFGYGWDLFGTTLYRIDIGVVDARFIWYLSVTAIVSGHIIAVWIGHVTAYSVFRDTAAARRSQYPMLVLMVGYTMLSLWILAQPIIEPATK